MKTEKWSRFDICDYIGTEEEILAYMKEALNSGSQAEIEDALDLLERTRTYICGIKQAVQEIYYLKRILHESGEKKLVDETISVLQLKNNSSYCKASSDAGNLIGTLLELLSEKDIFKTVHENLNK